MPTDLPHEPAKRALVLQDMLIAQATDGKMDDQSYQMLRSEFMKRRDMKDLLPAFVRRCKTAADFWDYIKGEFKQWAPRRSFIRQEFSPLLDYLEMNSSSLPSDGHISSTLETFDETEVHRAWEKALERSTADPEGAITVARTLLESVCKRILGEHWIPINEKDDLPKLFHAAAECLNLAPSQHTEPVFKAILGGCQNIVNSLGTLRNKMGDAHSQGRRQVRPSERHAALAVNLAGAMATFLVQTHQAKRSD